MKIRTSILTGLLIMGSFGAVNSAIAEDGVISKQEFTPSNEKFSAIRPSTLGTEQPTLKSQDTGDVIDFYGPCDENPLGKDQIQEQKLEAQHRRALDYDD